MKVVLIGDQVIERAEAEDPNVPPCPRSASCPHGHFGYVGAESQLETIGGGSGGAEKHDASIVDQQVDRRHVRCQILGKAVS
ncbi:hypothetical protein [Actinoplanes sp. NBRC 103695]|uniref:hypothetical protein n=1 Tax=Actinoplanes sp. NBRC 103695 TaxID=3032202 RepID=UPI002552DFDB|nr:hypothetical protein [Actinoplanes sp. NBRC 103695]